MLFSFCTELVHNQLQLNNSIDLHESGQNINYNIKYKRRVAVRVGTCVGQTRKRQKSIIIIRIILHMKIQPESCQSSTGTCLWFLERPILLSTVTLQPVVIIVPLPPQKWHHGAARSAQKWAEQCRLLTHDTAKGRWVDNYGACGQNIFVSTQKVPW